ncbi:MAG TPA: division/cell wall cluster transcriptional repressor MraZ [Spirochaetales bacterium]|nr:division/cell wall cluster transcriptional repressor MraZ [Spirochaetales bacterium]HRY54110.1 division/cell wall cluster transcriptional repressor MraZ [Spirochaetia bacterium]HRZ64081.1 division/cell wall cluster transcriptional repressor MraZ [Spirochaetia bacterium]
MNLLTGEFRNTLDEKGRISLPAKLRGELCGSEFVLTQGVDACLWLFAPEQWNALSKKLIESTSLFAARARLVQRRILAPAQEVEVDKLGRIAIPQSLREFAGLSKDCVILGITKYIEIWDAEAYKKYLEANESEFLAAAEELGGLTL